MNSRRYWEERAEMLRKSPPGVKLWYVGRTDLYSYEVGLLRTCYVHYAYPPDDGKRVKFTGTPTSALRKAVKYAEKKNEELLK